MVLGVKYWQIRQVCWISLGKPSLWPPYYWIEMLFANKGVKDLNAYFCTFWTSCVQTIVGGLLNGIFIDNDSALLPYG